MRVRALEVALLLASSPVALKAQFSPAAPAVAPPTPPFALQVTVGRESHGSSVLSTGMCSGPHTRRIEAAGRIGLNRWLFLEGTVARYDQPAGECSIDPPTPPSQGPATITTRYVESRIEGYPFYTTGLRVGAGLTDPESRWTWRVAAGPLWIWTKDLVGASATLELAYHVTNSPMQVVGGVTTLWYAVPYTDALTQYMDGVATSTSIEPRRETVTPRVFTLGVVWTF